MSIQINKPQYIKTSQVTDYDNKQPPIRVRQENLHLINTKQISNPRFSFFTLSNKITSRELLCVSDNNIQVYEPHNDSFRELDSKFKKYQKQLVVVNTSNNGHYICCLLQEGDLLIYRIKDKVFFNIKGVQKLERREDQQIQLYINDDATIIILKQQGQEYLWMWTMSKENLHYTQKETTNVQIIDSNAKKNSLFRSNSYDRRQSVQDNNQIFGENQSQLLQQQSEINLKGSWLRILNKDVSGPFQHRLSSYQEGFDLKFTSSNSNTQVQDTVKIGILKLYSKQEYFAQRGPIQSQQNQNDESMIVELCSQQLRVNYASKGGNQFESSSNLNNFKSKISSVEFIGQQSITKHRSIITKLDNSCQLTFSVLNSPHMVYCQAFFSNFDTSFSIAIKLFDFVNPDDCPTFDNRGKTNLCIDDVQWTNNDAFVIIIFSTCSFAVLPRLGSSLIAIFNPTIMNISQKMVDQFQHYKIPKKFNELILPIQIQQKAPSSKQTLIANVKTITSHPFEESFLISDGNLCFIFRMEFEPELTDLFRKDNMSFFFLRFCISLERLAIDQDILEKIPQLLTNKLPLFEFEKNAELDEEEDPGQVIMTASQINPYEHGQKRMETNQSFNAEFTLDCQVVLLNLKHLLMGLRWNKSSPINYYQWLITVVNDCFFYFLKNSEPIYAFHALRMAEAYCKKVLFLTETDNDQSQFEARNSEFHSQRTDFNDFNQLKTFFEAIHDMYDYHNTKEYMTKSTAEKLLIRYDMFDKLPVRLTRGSGNWRFQFTKNYALLVYYSLIQFRNYQAANFNILFLVFACYILQRYLDTMFQHHLQRIIEIVYRNFQLKKKSDDYELFLGKSGKNFIIGPPEKVKVYQDWVNLVIKFGLQHLNQMVEQENIENLIDICINELQGNNEKINKNLEYLGQNGKIYQFIQIINQNDNSIKPIEFIAQMIEKPENSIELPIGKVKDFNIGIILYILVEYIRRNEIMNKKESISLQNLLICISRMITSTSASHCTNFINQFSYLLDEHFQNSSKCLKRIAEEEMGIVDENEKRQILSVIYFYLNDIPKGIDILKTQENANKLMEFLLVSNSIKHSLRFIDLINQESKDIDASQFNSQEQIQCFQQRANCIQTIRKSLHLLKLLFGERFVQAKEEVNLYELWAVYSMLPQNASHVLKEELSHHCLKKMSKILKFIKISNPIQRQNILFKNLDKEDLHQKNQSISYTFLKTNIGPLFEEIFQQYFNNAQIYSFFIQNLEQTLISLMNQENGQLFFTQQEGELIFNEESEASQIDKEKYISPLIIKNFQKFSKIIYYLKQVYVLYELEFEIQNKVNQLILGKQTQIDTKNDNLQYFTQLLKLALFDKFQHSQILINKAFNIVKILIPLPENEQQLIEGFKYIQYNSLNRSNKQKLSQILEFAKQQKGMKGLLISTLENMMFSNNEIRQDETLEKLWSEANKELLEKTNNLKLKNMMNKGDNIVKKWKATLFERCCFLKEKLKISFDYSFYFDKASFERRYGNIFGLNDASLSNFQSAVQKKKQQRVIQQQKMKAQGENEQQHSFREKNGQPRHESISVESARSYSHIESPGRYTHDEVQNRDENIPQLELAKGLMRNRQLGNPITPNGEQKIDFRKLFKDGNNKVVVISKDKIKKNDHNDSKIRNESIDFGNGERGVAVIQNVTKRRESVRRQIALPQEEKNTTKQSNKQTAKGPKGHRKGQMSVNPQGFIGQNFNLRNQKFIDQGSTNNENKVPTRPGPPPGLPKANQASKKTTKSNRNMNQEQKIETFCKQIERVLLRKVIKTWKTKISQPKKSEAENPNKPQQILANKKGAFNLLLVKKEGNSYTVQDMKNILKQKPNSSQPPIIIGKKNELVGKPFELIRIHNQSISEDPNQLSNEKVRPATLQENPKVKHESSKAHQSAKKKQQKIQSKEQYLNFIQKFKQISEKIERVSKEANQLNQDFSKLN